MKFFKEINKSKLLYGGLIFTFVILYGATAFVSWYHSITFFNIANEVWLSVLLSFVAEIGQASVLFSLLLTSNKSKLLPWFIMIILTSLQVIGNVVSSYKFIIESNSIDFTYFQNSILFWVQGGTPDMFKVIIAWISGSLLPIIALSMTALVAQNMKLRELETQSTIEHPESEIKTEEPIFEAKDIISEVSRIRPTEDELKTLEIILKDKTPKDKPSVIDPSQFISPGVPTRERNITEQKQAETIPEPLIEDEPIVDEPIYEEAPIFVEPKIIESEIDDDSILNSIFEDEIVVSDPKIEVVEPEVLPSLSDEEVNEMLMDEHENKGEFNVFNENYDTMESVEPEVSPTVVETIVEIKEPEPIIPIVVTEEKQQEKKK